MKNPLPLDVEGLIKELEALYPPRCIRADEQPEEAHRYAGAAELVAGLRSRFDQGRKDVTAKDLNNVYR